MTLAQQVETWTCPRCGLWGQTSSHNPEGTNLAAHLAVVGCVDRWPPEPEATS